MYLRSPRRSGAPVLRVVSALLLGLLSGCVYGFVGGGLPSHIRTVAILPLENESQQPLIETDVQQALQLELPRSLGVRLADEQLADAVVRGAVTGFVEAPASVRPTQGPEQDQVPVVSREVRITYNLEIYDQEQDKVLWRANSQAVTGTYLPDEGQTVQDGKARALKELVNKVVEGAQSQW
jgi:hypothetical protein